MKYSLNIKQVDGDDYGDKQWRYYYELFDATGHMVWNDYTRTRPTLSAVLATIEKEVV